ncbi:type II toxin-antitoxin system Phd/YefM family antitoxin [Lujinxingia vulgaris]|uniref:Antitoxin n=1 Tax=Lujinxingia vulgaris TaxID=2600176 RepID=A0A5C6X1W1_9DELT|nr:type II toxin-antitoxin system Phd/YefM family antitoxin [Lujinxingia vulgaris]TXD35132.1 type II toxin-antitoxin system Phd/YefM family antitoxin [Lujinxingia vulgaris]
MTNQLSLTELRQNLTENLNRVSERGERLILHRNGKPSAALISCEDLALLEALEDQLDIKAALKARKEGGRVKWTDLKTELGLDDE